MPALPRPTLATQRRKVVVPANLNAKVIQPLGTPLPKDFTKMVTGVLTRNFDVGLKAYSKQKTRTHFYTEGCLFSDEILLCVSLISDKSISATTVMASVDFDPAASTPKAEDLLSVCVDALGAFFATYLDPSDPKKIAALATETLSGAEDVPFEWTKMDVAKRSVFLKVDKSNPILDQMADEWLAKHDPKFRDDLDEVDEDALGEDEFDEEDGEKYDD